MKKKLVMATIGAILLLGLTACGGDDEPEVPQSIIIQERQPTLVEQFLEVDDLVELHIVFDGSNIAEIHAKRGRD